MKKDFPMRILTIDDDIVNNLIIKENIKLIDSSIEVTDTTNLVDGVLFLKKCKRDSDFPELIFCDLNLPPYSATDFVRIFNKFFTKYHETTKLFIISAALDERIKAEMQGYSFLKGFLNKLDFDEQLDEILK